MPLPTHTIYTVKDFNGEEWTNVYTVYSLSDAFLETYVNALVDWELSKHIAGIVIKQARASTYPPGDKSYRVFPVQQAGERGTTGPIMPMFVTALMDIPVAGGGDPLRKYFHFGFDATDQNYGTLESAVALAYAQDFPVAVLDEGMPVVQLVDPQGNATLPAIVRQRLTHHQFRRGSKKQPLSQ